jgi:hypothetical protein
MARAGSLSFLALALALVSCGSGSPSTPLDAGRPAPGHDASVDHSAPVVDAGKPADAAREAHEAATAHDAGGCHGALAAADRTRRIVVSHPFDTAENASGDFEVFAIDGMGVITQPNVHFALGPTTEGVIAFTPDGAVGLVAEVMDPSGDRAYVIDDQTTGNGGGIYVVSIACDGSVKDEGLLTAADLPSTVIPVGGGDAVILAKNVKGSPLLPDGGADASGDAAARDGALPPGNDAVLVPWPSAAKVLGTADPFHDELAIVSAATLTHDGRYVLLGDNSQFSGIPNRVGVVSVGVGTIAAAGVVDNLNDPEGIVASPFDDAILVTSAFDNAIYALSRSESGTAPFALSGPVAYKGPAPQLPGNVVMIGRGTLNGRVLVAENQAIRALTFAAGGVITDLGPTASGDAGSTASIVGAIGVQP